MPELVRGAGLRDHELHLRDVGQIVSLRRGTLPAELLPDERQRAPLRLRHELLQSSAAQVEVLPARRRDLAKAF